MRSLSAAVAAGNRTQGQEVEERERRRCRGGAHLDIVMMEPLHCHWGWMQARLLLNGSTLTTFTSCDKNPNYNFHWSRTMYNWMLKEKRRKASIEAKDLQNKKLPQNLYLCFFAIATEWHAHQVAPWFLHWMELLCVHSLMGGLTWSQSCRWFLCQSHCGTTLLLSCCHSFCPLYWEICHFLANPVLKIGSCKSKQASVSLLFDFGSYVWDGSFSGCKWVYSPLMALVHWGEYFEDSVISWSFLLQWVFATP